MKRTTIKGLALALLLGPGTMLLADDNSDLDKSVTAMDAAHKTPAARSEAMERVSKQVGVPKEKLERQHKESGLGNGSLFIANTLAKETGKPFEEIVAAHKSGKGWGLIAKENGVKLGPLVSQARHAENEVRNAATAPKSRVGGGHESGPKVKPKPTAPKPRGGPAGRGGPRGSGGQRR